MQSTINVYLVEDDFYARNWMALLIARDWRTRLVGEAASLSQYFEQIKSVACPIDLILMDIDSICTSENIFQQIQKINHIPILFMSGKTSSKGLEIAQSSSSVGYIIKSEITYDLAPVLWTQLMS